MKNLTAFFYPKSIALIGASETLLKWGSYLYLNIIDGGFKGKLYPVSLKRDMVYGAKAYKAISDIKNKIDLVIITIPAGGVMDSLRDCVENKIKHIILISSGFSEVGEEGKRLEKDVTEYALENDLIIIGPNTMGIFNTWHNLYANGNPIRPEKGGISIISQSGNIAVQIMGWAEHKGLGVSKFIGSGNECMLSSRDYLEYLGNDEDTSLILMYIEGIDDGKRFLEVAKKVTLKKPVIALKSGRTNVGKDAAVSHSGSLAGSYEVFEDAMKQCGIILANTSTEMLLIASAFDSLPLPKGNRVGVVSEGGGWGVITADECELRGFTLPHLPDDIFKFIDKMLPSFWSKGNPVDLVGYTDHNTINEPARVMMSSEAFDSVVFLGVVGSSRFVQNICQAANRIGSIPDKDMISIEEQIEIYNKESLDKLIDSMEDNDKPIYIVAMFLDENKIIYKKNESKYRVLIFKSPESAVLCLSKQYEYYRYLQKARSENERS